MIWMILIAWEEAASIRLLTARGNERKSGYGQEDGRVSLAVMAPGPQLNRRRPTSVRYSIVACEERPQRALDGC